jgi:hypothetical protein
LIEQRLAIEIRNRGNPVRADRRTQAHHLCGKPAAPSLPRNQGHGAVAGHGAPVPAGIGRRELGQSRAPAEASVALRTKKGMIRPRGLNQQRYVKEILATTSTSASAGRYRQDLSGGGLRRRCAGARADPPHSVGAPGGRGRRKLGFLPAIWPRRSTRTCARCTTRCTDARLRIRGQADRAPGDRSRPAGLCAGAR